MLTHLKEGVSSQLHETHTTQIPIRVQLPSVQCSKILLDVPIQRSCLTALQEPESDFMRL